jgi:tRNA-dihydrouridine synthase B
MIRRSFSLGPLSLSSNIFYAPLAGCSDYPFRKMSALYRPGLHFCEMVKMEALVRSDRGTFHLLDYSHDMHPIGAQICGSNPKLAGKAAKIIEDLGFDSIDLNCGCPVDKVTKDGSGSGMLKTPFVIGECLANMVAAVRIPVTVKIRAGWDEESLVFQDIVRIAEDAGAKAITLHARTRKQAYTGPAVWDWIRQAKEVAKSILVIGNGDLYEPQDALNMIAQTGCDGVLIARGTLGQPWIASDILSLVETGFIPERTLEDFRNVLRAHFRYTMEYCSEREALVAMRRIGCWYFKKAKGTRNFRDAISHATSIDEVERLIEQDFG